MLHVQGKGSDRSDGQREGSTVKNISSCLHTHFAVFLVFFV